MNKIVNLYLATSIVALLFSFTYIYLEECYQDESFNLKTDLEKNLYVKYCSNPLSINPFDSYYSKIEMYLIYLGWLIGAWNLMDAIIILGLFNIEGKENQSYKNFVTKMKKIKKEK